MAAELTAFESKYLADVEKTRAARMAWWHQARFGMFIHWGLYAQLGRHEWVMNRERIPLAEYEKLSWSWKPKPHAAREWAALAKKAGMKYMVMTTKHHEGFLLWDSQLTDYCAAKRGPGRDLVREYVEAAREFGLKVGFYYSLMDWHHPDGHLCAKDEAARQRFTAYTQGCVRELCSNYGQIDILWYDVSWPLTSPRAWDSYRMNAMVRQLQPQILINDRSQLREDFGTPEEHIQAAEPGRAWEACMTFNGSWGWQPCPPEDWHSVRSVLNLVRTCTAGGGNLLLNIGPKPDGSVPPEAVERLTAVGKWVHRNGDFIYGNVDRVEGMEWVPTGNWTRRGKTMYFWCTRWPGKQLAIGGLRGKLVSARLHPDGKSLPFAQDRDRLVISGLPEKCPDNIASVAVLALTFKSVPTQKLGCSYEYVEAAADSLGGKWFAPHLPTWQLSKLMPKPVAGVNAARCVGLKDGTLGWHRVSAESTAPGFINVHQSLGGADGLVYFANRVKVTQAGTWSLHLGHDGGAKLFVNGKEVLCTPERVNPCNPDRSRATVGLKAGTHEIVVAFDTDHGNGWGIMLCFGIPPKARGKGRKPVFPKLV